MEQQLNEQRCNLRHEMSYNVNRLQKVYEICEKLERLGINTMPKEVALVHEEAINTIVSKGRQYLKLTPDADSDFNFWGVGYVERKEDADLINKLLK